MRETFSKNEKLCGKKPIEELFNSGKSFYIFPFKLIYRKNISEESVRIRILISIPKKYLRHSVDRNRMKRLVRESFRKRKSILLDSCLRGNLEMAFIYTGKMLLSFEATDRVIQEALLKLKMTLANEDSADQISDNSAEANI